MHVLCCMLSAACCLLSAAWCMLHVVCCLRHGLCCMRSLSAGTYRFVSTCPAATRLSKCVRGLFCRAAAAACALNSVKLLSSLRNARLKFGPGVKQLATVVEHCKAPRTHALTRLNSCWQLPIAPVQSKDTEHQPHLLGTALQVQPQLQFFCNQSHMQPIHFRQPRVSPRSSHR